MKGARFMAGNKETLRRQPRQERSRERVDSILTIAMRLIGEKGIAAVAMKEIASESGMPLATVYHYFPNKSAVIATLYQRYSAQTDAMLADALKTVSSYDSIIAAAEAVIDDYYERLKGDPSIQDLLNAIQADKALHNIDIEETRRQAAIFRDRTIMFIAPADHDAYGRSVYLLFQLAGGTLRLALMNDAEEGDRIVADYKRLIRGQLHQFGKAGE